MVDDTRHYLEDLHENQRRNERSKKRQGKAHAGHKLPNKQHGTNK
ncbi:MULTISPECIES: DUF4023 family protein [unclassified Paenibacillus]